MSANPCAVNGCDRPVSDAYVCTPCSLDLERALGDVRWLLEQLDVVLTRQTAKEGGGYVTGSSEQPIPYDLRASDARETLVNLVLTWARLVEDEHNEDEPPIGPAHEVCWHDSCSRIRGVHMPVFGGVGIIAAWLSSFSGWIRTHVAGADAVDEILAAVNAARKIIDIRPERWYAGPCTTDGCGHDLYANPTAQAITCPACGERFDVAERRAFLIASAHDHLGTAREISALCSGYGEAVSVGMIDGYVRRGKIAAKGSVLDKRGRTAATYRVGDVLDAAKDAQYDEREMRATKRASRVH